MGQFCTKASDPIDVHQICNLIHPSQTFYLEYRVALGWAGETEARDHPERFFKSQKDWLENGGSKMVAAVRIAAHLLSRDDAPPIIFDGEGGFEIPPLPDILDRSDVPGKTRKILVYQQWPIQSRLLIHVSFPSFISFCLDLPHLS
jgi:Helicase conserved C-terminal domain